MLAHIPRIALTTFCARGAQLLEIVAGGTHKLLGSAGRPLLTTPEEMCDAVDAWGLLGIEPQRSEDCAGAQELPTRNQHLALICLPAVVGPPILLAVEREHGATFEPQESSGLKVFGALAASALSRARLQEALRSSHVVETALLGAVRDSVLALDSDLVIRAMTGCTPTLMGVRFKDAIGKPLREVPGMAPLALALSAGDYCPEVVKLGTGEVRIRVRRYDHGLAVTLAANGGREPASPAASAAAHYHIEDLVGASPLIARARDWAARIADANLPVLLTGETGTGKEILAQAIHSASRRANEPFVGVNVPAIPHQLLESELFGYEPGAFTGASPQGRAGKFEMAESGTILLDEIGDMPLDMQAKLLRVLEERTIERIGGTRALPFNAQVIASTNRDLDQEVRAGRFRLDLLHRIRVMHLRLPPLRERKGDVSLIVEHVLRLLARKSRRDGIALAPSVLRAFENHAWPGNVRELVHVLESEVSLLPADKGIIDAVPQSMAAIPPSTAHWVGREVTTLEEAEREVCARALQKTMGNVVRAALLLGVAKNTLYSKMRRYGLDPMVPGLRSGECAARKA